MHALFIGVVVSSACLAFYFWPQLLTDPLGQGTSELPPIRRVGDEFDPVTVVQNPLPPITDAPIATVEEVSGENATYHIADNELVLGVELNGEARAYPINMLTGPNREIINDELGGQAIAATW